MDEDQYEQSYSINTPSLRKINLYIAQLRFQFKGYTEDEWKALSWWIKQQPDPAALEDYFIQDVLRYRPQDRERYLFSPLHDLFQQIKMKPSERKS